MAGITKFSSLPNGPLPHGVDKCLVAESAFGTKEDEKPARGCGNVVEQVKWFGKCQSWRFKKEGVEYADLEQKRTTAGWKREMQ